MDPPDHEEDLSEGDDSAQEGDAEIPNRIAVPFEPGLGDFPAPDQGNRFLRFRQGLVNRAKDVQNHLNGQELRCVQMFIMHGQMGGWLTPGMDQKHRPTMDHFGQDVGPFWTIFAIG